MTFDKSTNKLCMYINGEYAGAITINDDLELPTAADAQWVGMGGDAHGGNWAQYTFTGAIAIARMYGKSLSPNEVRKLFGAIKTQ